MNDLMDLGFDNVHKYESIVLKTVFPNSHLKQSSFMGNPDKPVKSFDGKLSSIDLFKDTIYEYTGDGLFLHFTSLPILSVILNSGFLRMSDFNCLNDTTEIHYATEHVFGNSNSEQLKREKCKMFCLSACASAKDVILNSHMWENYADHGKGCAIEYKFSSKEIHKMSFGKIQYGKRNLKPLKYLKLLDKKFADENDGFQLNNIESFLTPLSAFHKDIRFKNEQEIRLFFHKDGSIGNVSPHLNEYSDFYKSNQVRNFIKIYLKGRNKFVPYPGLPDKDALGASPQIEISRVILGPNVKNIFEIVRQLLQLKTISKQDFEIWKVNSTQEYSKINC